MLVDADIKSVEHGIMKGFSDMERGIEGDGTTVVRDLEEDAPETPAERLDAA